MDEASRLITELQLKLAQLDRKICLYQQDMAAEFEKYADDLLQGVPEEVMSTVNKAVAESMKSYPALLKGSSDRDNRSFAVNVESFMNGVADDAPTVLQAAPDPPASIQLSGSPDVQQNTHEREIEFQGLFTPSYLPLLDSTDRNERKPSTAVLLPPFETGPLNIVARQKAIEDVVVFSTSDPTSSQSTRSLPTFRRRGTDEGSSLSEQSDTPTRRSALRRKSSDAKSQSPRHVRFEFEGEEFPTTSSPKLDPEHEPPAPVTPIILSNGDDPAYDGGSDQLDDEDSPSPPRRRISSSEALRLMSRRPLEDNGVEWTEVKSPADGSSSVPILDISDSDSDDDDVLSMQPLSATAAAARSGSFAGRRSNPRMVTRGNVSELGFGLEHQSKQEVESKNREKTIAELAEEQHALSRSSPLQTTRLHRPLSAITAVLEQKIANKTQTVAIEKSKVLSNEPLGGLDTDADLDIVQTNKDADELFTFEEAFDSPNQPPVYESESDAESSSSRISDNDRIPTDSSISISTHSTATALSITPLGINRLSSRIPDNDLTASAAPSSQRNSLHPFSIPIVTPAIHAQAASLGDLTSFVGSIKDGLDEDALQSFRAESLRTGVGNGMGVTPRSLSEKMALEGEDGRRRKR